MNLLSNYLIDMYPQHLIHSSVPSGLPNFVSIIDNSSISNKMLSCDLESIVFLKPSKVQQSENQESKFDNKWLRSRRNHGGPKPLALFQDDILTNSAAWKAISKAGGSKMSTEKLSLPKTVSLTGTRCSKICQIQQNGKICKFLINCGKNQVVAINFEEKHENFGQSTVLAEDLDQITCVEITSNGKWLAIGIQSQIWILSLEWNNFQITQIEHFATFEGHREPVSNLHFVDCPGFDTRLISTSHDRTFNIWSVHKLECMYESPLLGHYSLTSSCLMYGQKSSQILILGNCEGKLYFYEINSTLDDCTATKVDEMVLNQVISNTNAQPQCNVTNSTTPKENIKEVPSIRPKRRGAKNKSLLPEPPTMKTEEAVDKNSHQGCEVMNFLPFPKSNGPFEPQYIIVGTTVGLSLVNVNTREMTSSLSFDHLTHEFSTDDVLSTMVSSLILSWSRSSSGDINVLTQCMTDEKTAFFRVKFQSTIDEERVINIVAQDMPQGFYRSLQKTEQDMKESLEELVPKPKTLSAKIRAMASSRRRVQSSGYGKAQDQCKMFQPRVNLNSRRNTSKPSKAWESHDEGFISPTSSLEDLSSESSEHKPRGRWKHPKMRPEESKFVEKLNLSSTEGPKKIKGCVRLWQTDGVHTRLFFSPNGSAVAASGAHNSVQVIPFGTLQKMAENDDLTRCDTLEKGARLMGHIAPVNSVDFANGNSDYLVTSGRDRAVKIWHWKSKTVKLTVDLRKHGRGAGLGRGSVFGSVYGGITAQANNSQFLQKKHKKSEKYDDSVKPFPDSVTQCQFYYMDQFLLSASSSKLFVHQIGLPTQQQQLNNKKPEELWFKNVHSFDMDHCKNVTSFCAPNQFYSHMVIIGCSDKSLRILDMNAQQMVREIPHCHAKPITKLVLAGKSNGSGNILNSSSHNLYLTAAVSDGAKIWDLREPNCVQKFSWPGSNFGRIQLGVDVCPNFQYFAGGSDDGSVYIYDLRKPCTGYVSRLMGGSSKHTNPNHSNGYNRSPITDAAFHSIKSNILVVSTLEGEILRFE